MKSAAWVENIEAVGLRFSGVYQSVNSTQESAIRDHIRQTSSVFKQREGHQLGRRAAWNNVVFCLYLRKSGSVASRKSCTGSGISCVASSRNGNVSKRTAKSSFEFQVSSFETKASVEDIPTLSNQERPGTRPLRLVLPQIVEVAQRAGRCSGGIVPAATEEPQMAFIVSPCRREHSRTWNV